MTVDDCDYNKGGKCSTATRQARVLYLLRRLHYPTTYDTSCTGAFEQLRIDQPQRETVVPEGHICGAGWKDCLVLPQSRSSHVITLLFLS